MVRPRFEAYTGQLTKHLVRCWRNRQVGTGWLRRGLQWCCKVGLETSALSWGTVQLRIEAIAVFDPFLAGRDVPGPWLADGPDDVRALMLEFLGHVRGLRVQRPGPNHGQPLSQSRVSALLNGVEQFYAFMHDHRAAAATALTEPGWLRLRPEHAVFFRRGEKPPRSRLWDSRSRPTTLSSGFTPSVRTR